MILRYNGISSAMREDAVEYLEATEGYGIASAMTSPTFGFKTYEGDWFCVDIEYNEDKQFILQRFKIDSSVGDLDGSSGSMTGTGDGSRISSGVDIERAYYWKITNPESVELPTTAPNGEIYTKTANDNGDGTFDVIITKEVATNLTATSSTMAGPPLFGGGVSPGAYTETTDVSTNNIELEFGINAEDIPDAVIGEIKSINNVALENGMFRTTVTTRTAIAQRVPPESQSGGGDYPWLEYGSDFIQDANNIIVGRNQPWDQVIRDRDRTNIAPALLKINSMSVHMNDYGLFDYTIISNSPG
jgi:hypothetical protein